MSELPSPPRAAPIPGRPERTPADTLQWAGLVAVAVVTIVADQVTKLIARRSFSPDDPSQVLPFFQFTYTRNTGIAFGQFQDNQIFVIALSCIAIGWMFVYFARSGGRHALLPVALGLLAGGAIGNLADRLRQGYVTDFLQVASFPVFNLADTAITVGVILLLLVLLGGERRPAS